MEQFNAMRKTYQLGLLGRRPQSACILASGQLLGVGYCLLLCALFFMIPSQLFCDKSCCSLALFLAVAEKTSQQNGHSGRQMRSAIFLEAFSNHCHSWYRHLHICACKVACTESFRVLAYLL